MNFDMLLPDDLKKEKERIQSLYAYQISNEEEAVFFERLLEVVLSSFNKPLAVLAMSDPKKTYIRSTFSSPLPPIGSLPHFSGHLFLKEKFIEVTDTLLDNELCTHVPTYDQHAIRYLAAIPVGEHHESVTATLYILDLQPGKLSAKQKILFRFLGNQTSDILELRAQRKQLELLNSGLLNALQLQLKEQNKVLELFSRFVPKEIVRRHLATNEHNYDDAELKTMTVLFCDIRGYTSMVENLPPSEAVAILKIYYTVMSDVIGSLGGMVNQYVGDEIFATFGAPFTKSSYEMNAVLCAIEMMEKMKKVNELCRPYTTAEIRVGIGIHSGEVVTCTLGSKEKIEYSVTGDTVNTGKRIESITQSRPGTILISHEVYEKVAGNFEFKMWEPLQVKGKAIPVRIYEVTGPKEINSEK